MQHALHRMATILKACTPATALRHNVVRIVSQAAARNPALQAAPSWRPTRASSTSTPSETTVKLEKTTILNEIANSSVDTNVVDGTALETAGFDLSGDKTEEAEDLNTAEETTSEVSETLNAFNAINAEIGTLVGELKPAEARPITTIPPNIARRPRPVLKPGQKEFLRFARIFGLHPETTMSDITQGLSDTAPVGRVLSIKMEKKRMGKDGEEVAAAVVLFDHDAAVTDLVRLAKQQTFHVKSVVPHVAIYTKRAFHSNDTNPLSSRVLRITGPADTEHFSEEGIRRLVLGNEAVVRALGPLGLESESAITEDRENRTRIIEWRFFDNQRQVLVMLQFLRRVFKGQLFIKPGRDPCWNSMLFPWDRETTPYKLQLRKFEPSKRPSLPPARPSSRKDATIAAKTTFESSVDPDDEYLKSIRNFRASLASPKVTEKNLKELRSYAEDTYGTDAFNPKVSGRLDELMELRQAALDALNALGDFQAPKTHRKITQTRAPRSSSLAKEDRERVLAWRRQGARG